jgi:peroxiredoxin
MIRCWIVLVVIGAVAAAVVPVHGGGKPKEKIKDVKFEGTLDADSPKDPTRNTPCKIHVVPMKKGQRYTIDMVGAGFDAYLRLEDSAGVQLAEDDDSGGDLNAQIVFNCPKDGDYKIYCTCVGNGAGKYTLTIKASAGLALAVGHAALVGKPAPDFQGDSALNGKPIKLSELKGSVVLLNFWAIHASGCVSALPRLREWHKLHKDAGLEVVGVTFFNSQLGQKLGFDPAEGKLKNLTEASPETDETMFQQFAAHHKLDYLLLALHKEKALSVFDGYLVNGLPQTVLIDRKGIIRHTYVGDLQAGNPEADAEIRRLLRDK